MEKGSGFHEDRPVNAYLFSVWFLEVEYWNLFGNWIVEISLPGVVWFHENGPKALVQHALRSLMLFIASRATKLGEEGGNEAREFARDVLEPMVMGG